MIFNTIIKNEINLKSPLNLLALLAPVIYHLASIKAKLTKSMQMVQ